MKKILFILLLAVSGAATAAVQIEEPLILINPWRETFINFPSETLPGKTVTFFLPEKSVPLQGRYPVIYVLGAIPKDAPKVTAFMEQTSQKAIVVGINVTESDLADAGRLTRFFTQELIPYVDTNYPTLADAAHRALAAAGPEGGVAAFSLLYQRNLFSKVLLAEADPALLNAAALPAGLRLAAIGGREDLAALQTRLEGAHFHYGKNFILQERAAKTLVEELPAGYWFAPEKETLVKKLLFLPSVKTLPVTGGKISLNIKARLRNGEEYAFYPETLRISPPFLDWNAEKGAVSVIPGAEPGRVKMSVTVNDKEFSTKIKLKKQ